MTEGNASHVKGGACYSDEDRGLQALKNELEEIQNAISRARMKEDRKQPLEQELRQAGHYTPVASNKM